MWAIQVVQYMPTLSSASSTYVIINTIKEIKELIMEGMLYSLGVEPVESGRVNVIREGAPEDLSLLVILRTITSLIIR